MTNKLPKLTPSEIRKWVESVEDIYPVNALAGLPEDATIEEIEDAFSTDRCALMGIGEELMERAKWDAWTSYRYRITYDDQ